jgi:hypothetical protein
MTVKFIFKDPELEKHIIKYNVFEIIETDT